MAIVCIDQRRGLRVPQDVSVASFGGIGASKWLNYRLTLMRQPIEQMVDSAVELIAARVSDPSLSGEQRSLFMKLEPGATTLN